MLSVETTANKQTKDKQEERKKSYNNKGNTFHDSPTNTEADENGTDKTNRKQETKIAH